MAIWGGYALSETEEPAGEAADLREEYDFASMSGGVRGKYAERLRAAANVVILDDDIAEAIPNDPI